MSASISTSNVSYPVEVNVWIDYGLRSRFCTGLFKDITNKSHDVAMVIDPMELGEYMKAPLTFREFQAVSLWIITNIFLAAFLTILYLVFIFTMIEEIEEGLAARDIYYVILALLGILGIVGVVYRKAMLRRKITEYVDGLNRQVFAQRGVEFTMTYPWGCKGYRLKLVRYKEDPDMKNSSLMIE